MTLVNVFAIVQTSFNTLWAPMAVEHYSKDPDDKSLYYTNISDDKKVTCVDCENLKNVLSVKVQEECYGEFYTYGANGNISGEDNKVNA